MPSAGPGCLRHDEDAKGGVDAGSVPSIIVPVRNRMTNLLTSLNDRA